jgi:hypothetical protein
MAEDKSLAAKLHKVQEEVGAIKKDSTNPFFKSKYADINSFIEVVKPILTKHGVVLLQPLENATVGSFDKQGGMSVIPMLRTVLIDAETGEKIWNETPIPFTFKNPQEMGSAITYMRRYALQSMLFLQAEDDDGELASPKVAGTNLDYPKRTEKTTPNFDGKGPTETNDIINEF